MEARGNGKSPRRRSGRRGVKPGQDVRSPALRSTDGGRAGGATVALALDADERAILVLCCSQHVIACPACRNTLRIGWLGSMGRDEYPCPLCSADLAPVVVAHTRSCTFFTTRSARKPPVKIDRAVPPPEAAIG